MGRIRVVQLVHFATLEERKRNAVGPLTLRQSNGCV